MLPPGTNAPLLWINSEWRPTIHPVIKMGKGQAGCRRAWPITKEGFMGLSVLLCHNIPLFSFRCQQLVTSLMADEWGRQSWIPQLSSPPDWDGPPFLSPLLEPKWANQRTSGKPQQQHPAKPLGPPGWVRFYFPPFEELLSKDREGLIA